MKYRVGKYSIAPEKPFKTMDQAVQFVQKRYPELDKETIEKYINPSIKENDTDKSGNINEKASGGKKADPKASAGGAEEGSTGKD